MSKKPKTAIVPTREDNFPEWYQQVIKAAGMAENAPVRGCMTIKPYGYAVWENMQRIFDSTIKDMDVENAYFPLLIPLEFISREAEHIDGFAKECAVVTHHRLEDNGNGGLQPAGELEEPYVIRPTSETIIGDSMSRWIQSYRDLPMKLNQWANVMRWEMRTRLFLRTSEFLWQEGHNAFETAEEARLDALKMIAAYEDFVENTLALPVIVGEKTEDERFPGANNTYTIEAMMQDGKALQAGTSHDLGQNFSKSCGIKFQGRDGDEELAWTTSWGISTRLIGAMIMVHGDDNGMIMPPHIAPIQVGILPIVKGNEHDDAIYEYAEKLKSALKKKGIRAKVDISEARTPDKMWGMIKQGIPLRVEIGANEVQEDILTHVRRDLGRDSKTTSGFSTFIDDVEGLLDAIHGELFQRAKVFRDNHIFDLSCLDDVEQHFKGKDAKGFARVDVSLIEDQRYEDLKKRYSLTSRCMPLDDDGAKVLVAKAY
ncbi:MAG: proline--tRNA ligase [Bdellovibrionales bacterium]